LSLIELATANPKLQLSRRTTDCTQINIRKSGALYVRF
jgi:hypothetical protein